MSDETPKKTEIARTNPRHRGPITWPDDMGAIRADFLEEYVRNGGVISSAARAVNISPNTIANWLKKDPEFKQAFEWAHQEANDTIRREIVRRAIDGYQREVYQHGKFVGYETIKSDQLLQFLAKSRMSEFRDRMDITSNDQHVNAHETIVEAVNDEQTTNLAAELLERLANIGNHTGRTGLAGEQS